MTHEERDAILAEEQKIVKDMEEMRQLDGQQADQISQLMAEMLGIADEELHPLYPIFMAAISQCINGKGHRHGGNEIPFTEQRWVRISNGPAGIGGLVFQAIKKLEESLEKDTDEDFEREILGAMAYMGMVYLKRLGHV